MNGKFELEAPILSRSQIRQIALDLLDEYREVRSDAFDNLNAIEFWHFYERVIKPKYGITIEEKLDLGPSISGVPRLGTYNIPRNHAIIGIPPSDRRRIWTLWHEVVGHGVLHGPYLRKRLNDAINDATIDVTEVSFSSNAVSQIEMQANYLAAQLSAPKEFVTKQVIKVLGLHLTRRPVHFTGPGEYSLTVNGHDLPVKVFSYHHLCRVIAEKISANFGGLSTQSLAYRVDETGLICQTKASSSINYKLFENNGLDLNRLAI